MARTLTAILVSAALAAFAAPVQAYPDKDIDFVIPYNPGGGFDGTVRAVAPFLEKYLPKKVNVVPKNVPGAGGRKGATTVYRAKPDGYTIGIFNMPGFIIPAVLGEKVDYDLSKITWLGRVEATQYVLLVNAKSEFTTLEDLRKHDKPIKFVATGFGSSALAAAQIGAHVMDIEATFLPGYTSAPAYMVGLVRGDGEAAMGIVQTARKFIQSGDLRALVSFETNSSFDGVPSVKATKFGELEGMGIDRVVGAPPGLPDEIASILADALGKVLKDPDFIAQAAKSNMTLDPQGPEDARRSVLNSVNVYEKYKSILTPPN